MKSGLVGDSPHRTPQENIYTVRNRYTAPLQFRSPGYKQINPGERLCYSYLSLEGDEGKASIQLMLLYNSFCLCDYAPPSFSLGEEGKVDVSSLLDFRSFSDLPLNISWDQHLLWQL